MNEQADLNSPPPWADGPYIIKRFGTTLMNCDSEPVQTPGCIQGHGALLVLRLTDLTILQASENSSQYYGLAPEQLWGQSIACIVGSTETAHIQGLLATEQLEGNARYIFTLSPQHGNAALDVNLHTSEGVAILEFEATQRSANLGQSDFFDLVKTAVCRLQTTRSLREFCQQVSDEVRMISGLDRVMVYRFHADDHGEVFAESKRADLAPWLGLHYPESDIPKPAREIFKRIWIRPLQDAAGELVELRPLANPDTGRPLNMTHCALRGASVMYTEYLANIGVAASLTMPIMCDGELWGLIACHQIKTTHFSYEVRAACEFIAQVASLQIKSAEQSEQLIYRLKLEGIHQQLVAKAAQAGDLMALIDHQPSLLDAMVAGGVALYHLQRWWCLGQTPETPALEALAEWLNQRPELDSASKPVFVTDALPQIYAEGSAIATVASGILAVPLARHHRDLIIWFRPETLQTVNWAGNPLDKPSVPGPNGDRLTPRRSFDLFVESVQQRALPWSSIEIDSALRLRLLVMELVISRAERLADLNADLTRSNEELDAFAYVASHDLKEPLRGIHRYAHQLLESAQNLDAENRQRVEGLMRLTVRMDCLLDSLLHFSRVGRTQLEFESVDLNEVIEEALEMIGARRAEQTCTLIIPRPFSVMHCDRVRVREIYSNLVSNALKYNQQASPQVELGYIAPTEIHPFQQAPAEANGHTIYYVRDNGIGIEARHFEQIFRMFKRLHGREEFGGGVGAGLTIVQKLVQRHGGCIWLESSLNSGTSFYFTLPCSPSRLT